MSEKVELPIQETRLYRRLNIPNPKIFEMDVPLLLYKGRVFKLAESQKDESYIKVFDSVLGFEEAGSHAAYEVDYFKNEGNISALNEAKRNFIRSLLAGTTREERKLFYGLGDHVLKKIEKHYSDLATKDRTMPYVGKGQIRDPSRSMFSKLQSYERVLMLDEKLYDLLTMPEFLEKFRRSFEPSFFAELQRIAARSEPERVSAYLTSNVSRMNEKALPLVRNKIWHSKRSCKLFFDGVYFVPNFRGSSMFLLDRYKGLLESKVKSEAINEHLLSEVC